jgi:P4 family phage/plasmid primase-like protien
VNAVTAQDIEEAKAKRDQLLASALAYAKLGMPVFPCHTPIVKDREVVGCSCNKNNCNRGQWGKHPRTLNGLNDATVDEAKIRQWWKTFPFANIGVRTGFGIFAIDIDTKNSGSENWAELIEKHGKLPATVECITGSGGRHIYFRAPDGMKVKSSVREITNGVDVRGDGGYCIAPPSLHGNGKHYVWELSSDPLEGVPVAPAPDWLLALLTPKQTTKTVSAGSEDAILEGGRNDALFSLGRTMRSRGASPEVISVALREANEHQCKPPLDPKEVEIIVAQVCKVKPGFSEEVKERLAAKAAAQAVQKAQPKPVTQPTPPAMPAAAPVAASPRTRILITAPSDEHDLERGDHVELAELLLTKIQGNAAVMPVHDREELWRFVPETGLWQVVSLNRLLAITSGFAGMKVGNKELKLKHGDLVGIVKIAKAMVDENGFFSKAPPGIAFTNGFVTVDATGISLVPLDPSHRACTSMPFAFDPDAKTPRWDKYLEEVFSVPPAAKIESTDDEPLTDEESRLMEIHEKLAYEDHLKKTDPDRKLRIAMLQEHAGACLVGSITKYAVAMVLTGSGANGKSVYLSVIQALFPHDAVTSIAPHEWGNKFYLAELAGARLNSVNEMPDNEIADSAGFKSIVSGDAIMVARKHERPFHLFPKAGHLFACNELPSARDLSEGFWRRFMVVTFDRSFRPEERDIDLPKKIIHTELPGIAVWALKGAHALARRGHFQVAESSRDAAKEWKHNSDQVQQFLEDAIIPSATEKSPIRSIYAAYRCWAQVTGHPCLSERRFATRLKKVATQESNGEMRFYRVSIREEYIPKQPRQWMPT